jgi:hypothetical protein
MIYAKYPNPVQEPAHAFETMAVHKNLQLLG